MLKTICGSLWLALLASVLAHEAKDFDDSVLYKIDFQMPDFDNKPELLNHVRTFYTHEKEKYDCVIPVLEESKAEVKSNKAELSPFALLQPMFTAPSCSYRIEAYWSYEICHGTHVRQYHEEREGKAVKFQEYYLGKWNKEKSDHLVKAWEEAHKLGDTKYKTTKIDNTKYPYFEMEFTDGTMCDIINAPRTTIVRYVCYPHSKNDIYSFKETSSCNYEAIILTSLLCVIPGFLPEESKEVSIKCFNSQTEPHKPLSMLRQELSEMQISEDDFPMSKEAKVAAAMWSRPESVTSEKITYKFDGDVDKLILELMTNGGIEVETEGKTQTDESAGKSSSRDLTALKDFISGKNCLTGGTGWWKYEFCYGRHVRQFHKDKKSETELFLGFFSQIAHQQWLSSKPDKSLKREGMSHSIYIWHHYEGGTRCDRTGLLREVDVKLTCMATNKGTSMYLLEPKTCQYILVIESPIICDLIQLADDSGLVQTDKLNKLIEQEELTKSAKDSSDVTEKQEEIRA